MIKSSFSSLEERNSNSVQNASSGFRELQGVQQWPVDAESNFAMTVEEQDVLMEAAQDQGG